MRRVTSHKVLGENPMRRWGRIAGRLRPTLNFILIYLARFVPWVEIKNSMYRLTGMRVGKNVSVGLFAMFDIFFPHLISIGDNSVIGYNATILAHEFLVDEWRTGRVNIGKNVLIGANCTVLPGVDVGDGAVIGALSLVNCDVPPGAFYAGIPARPVKSKD